DSINWKNNGELLKSNKNTILRNPNYYFKEGITWTLLSSSYFGVRILDEGAVFDVNGMSMFIDNNQIEREYFLGLLSSNVSHTILKIINPTLAFQVGDINKIPLIYSTEKKNEIINHVKNNIYISKKDWNSRETS